MTSRATAGSSPRPILAIHGSASSGAIWQSLTCELEGKRVVLAPDLPGYGKLAASAEPDAASRFDWLGDLIHSLGGKFDLIGHSFGGCVAMRLANQHPTRIGHVVLYEPIVPPGPEGVTGTPMQDLHQLWIDMRDNDVETAMDCFCNFWSGQGSWHQMGKRARDRLTSNYDSVILDFQQMFGGQLSVANPIFEGDLTILHGDKSPSVVDYMVEKMSAIYPQATTRLLPRLGHMGPISHPKIVNTVFADLLGLEALCERVGRC